ncbi:hypothetical protein GT755_31995 [Herbidospora sp. NEAU-GS84]|uniref:Uncharacterized protein n=1 Tax=Herbidospora solisilvae TaxID=2696284 RepID=A0A7C9JJ22_9ACTN|nr:hypothetical protein [Herbidospora solisilvae]NAS26283.1 hypothetical protein [Herbidospora solisilvae]
MSPAKHRRPSRGGWKLTAEQLSVLTLAGVLVATGSFVTDVIGAFEPSAPIVVSLPGPTVTVTEPAGGASSPVGAPSIWAALASPDQYRVSADDGFGYSIAVGDMRLPVGITSIA